MEPTSESVVRHSRRLRKQRKSRQTRSAWLGVTALVAAIAVVAVIAGIEPASNRPEHSPTPSSAIPLDRDRDGLLDTLEVGGWRSVDGRVFKSNPTKADTDGDGLNDGREAGPQIFGLAPIVFRQVLSDPEEIDSDDDGLLDQEEVNGWITLSHGTFRTDPRNGDSDSDGLSDRQEAGPRTFGATSLVTYSGASDPTRNDSDSDALDDASELDSKLNPWSKDSDGDRLEDFDEIEFGSDPLVGNSDGDHLTDAEEYSESSNPHGYDLTKGQSVAAFSGGVAFGDSDWLAKNLGRLNSTQLDSWQYLAGSLVSGLVSVGDIRDAIANIIAQNWPLVIVSLVALVPALGDAGRLTTRLSSFAKRGNEATTAALRLVESNKHLSEQSKTSLSRSIVKVGGDKARLSADRAISGTKAPPALSVERPVGKSATQNARKDQIVRDLKRDGCTGIRVNQQQVDIAGNLRGTNRPDIQAACQVGRKIQMVHFELDRTSSDRGPMHRSRIIRNDHTAIVNLEVVD